jgi:pheromone shutdown-related protein TraB
MAEENMSEESMNEDMMAEENVTRIQLDGREIILIGTAHVSKQSAQQVKEVIESERPDTVCIELDEQRYQSMMEGSKWQETDIFKVIKEGKATLLLVNLMVSSFQKRMAKQFGIQPGLEMLQGVHSAREIGAELVLADRNIQITFSRIWHNVGFWGKVRLMGQIVQSIFSSDTITEEELERMKSKDMLDSMLQEFTEHFPRLKTPLIDERDKYLAQKIKEAPGSKVVAVLGAAHVPGIVKQIHHDHDLEELSKRPPKSKIPAIIGWAIPALIVAILVYSFIVNPSVGFQQTLSWVLWTGTLSALGTALALAHPAAIVTGFVAAPFTTLHPLLAAGWFAGIAQAYFQRPNVRDFEQLSEDVLSVKGFWRNKVTRILLVVTLSNIGASIGTFVGGANMISRLFGSLW